MINQKSGKIINISSMWGEVGASCEVHYSATKSAVIGFTKALSKEVGRSGIRVNCVAPGFIETEMTQVVSEEARKAWLDSVPMKRIGSVKDVADATVFLASDMSTYITAQVLGVDGGMGA
jgi:3-oxoacyl-[acyl-carrier protein] reductase